MLARWLGNPSSAIGGTLWNIRVTGRCAALLERFVAAAPANPGGTAPVPRRWCRRAILARASRWLDGGHGGPGRQQLAPPRGDSVSDLRDSLYLLTVLNQFELNYVN